MVANAKRAVTIKDFKGGLNNVTDMSNLPDGEVAVLVNLEPDAHGALASRPPITFESAYPAGGTTPAEFIGYFQRADGVTFLVIAQAGKTYLYDPLPNTFTQIATFQASDCVQYLNRLYLVCRTARGGWWGETVAGSGTYTFQSLAGGTVPMPMGDQIVLYKERLWISGWGTPDERVKLYLSEVTNTVGGDINNWPILNFIYVGRGDGQRITKLKAGANDLSIFRNASAYYFRYDSDPSLGSLTKYPGNVGCDNKYCLISYEGYDYVLSNGGLYQMVSYMFYRRNDTAKVQFETRFSVNGHDQTTSLSLIGNRAVVWYSGRCYAFNLAANAWSEWESTANPGVFRNFPRPEGYFGPEVSYGITGSADPAARKIYRITESANSTDSEVMECRVRTRAMDYDFSDRFKVLFWWSVDCLTAGNVKANAVPVLVTASSVTYDMMATKTYDELSLGTYDSLFTLAQGQTFTRTNPSGLPQRVSAKFPMKRRFRRIYYDVTLTTDGSLGTGPVFLFSIVTYIETRQKTSRGVT